MNTTGPFHSLQFSVMHALVIFASHLKSSLTKGYRGLERNVAKSPSPEDRWALYLGKGRSAHANDPDDTLALDCTTVPSSVSSG